MEEKRRKSDAIVAKLEQCGVRKALGQNRVSHAPKKRLACHEHSRITVRQALRTIGALCLAILAVPLPALAQSMPDILQTEAEEALVAGRPRDTVQIATQMLAVQPDSFIALYLLALGQSDIGDLQAATTTGARAYRAAITEDNRFQAARFVAGAHFRAREYSRSEIWLRRAANHVQNATDLRTIAQAYATTVEANPLSVQIAASIAPSDNVNNGSEDGVLQLEGIGLTFILPEDRRSLSGVGFSASSELKYRISQGPQQSTQLIGSLSAVTYALSQDAKDLLASSPNPEVRAVKGSDFSTVTAAIGISRQQNNISPFGPVNLGLNLGTYWEGGERLVNFRDLSIEQVFPINRNNRFRLTVFNRDQDALTPALLDSTTTDLIGTYDHILANSDQLQLSFSTRRKDAGFENSFDEYQIGVGYAVAEPLYGIQLSTSLQIGYRTYEEFTTTLDGRDDQFISASGTAKFRDVSYFGFSPSITLATTRTESTAEEFTSSTLQLLFGVESNF